jgi:hypothetical protein
MHGIQPHRHVRFGPQEEFPSSQTMTDKRNIRHSSRKIGSKIGDNQLVRPFATAPIDLGGNCINQVAVQIEGAEKSVLVELHVGCDSPQSIISHEKRRLHSAVVPPSPATRVPSSIETTEQELMHTVFPHPTLSEMMKEAVLDAYGRVLNI